MDRDIRLALLGDHEAAKRLTEAGVLLPCCGVQPILHRFEPLNCYGIECGENGHIHNTSFCDSEYEARLAWNTRAPILSESEMEVLYEGRSD